MKHKRNEFQLTGNDQIKSTRENYSWENMSNMVIKKEKAMIYVLFKFNVRKHKFKTSVCSVLAEKPLVRVQFDLVKISMVFSCKEYKYLISAKIISQSTLKYL